MIPVRFSGSAAEITHQSSLASPAAADVSRVARVVVTVGKLGQYPAFRKLLAEGPF